MQPVTMAYLIAVVILSELPSFSALINSSSPSAIPGKPVSPLVEETMGNTVDELPPSNFVNIPVFGDVYPNGFYYVSIKIGNKPPNRYNLDIDTGSDVTWLPKGRYPRYESHSIRYVRCNEPRCTDLHESTSREGECKNTERCHYEINYQDETTTKGFLVTDSFTLHLKEGSSIHPTLAIGRSYKYPSKGPNSQSKTHGMLGLGKGRISILSQLRHNRFFANIFGHCLSSNPRVSGFMFIGKDFDYSRCLTWVPMSSDVPLYSLAMDEIVYGDEQLLVSNQDFVLDSGTTHTYFIDPLYQQLLSVVTKTPLQKTPGDVGYRHCWKGTKPFDSISDIRSYFPTLKLKFGEGRVMEIPPDNYFIIRGIGDACLAIFNGSDIKLSFNLIGGN
ncbi:hypothetical protein KFK09_022416 [Dendrobium nobile]|uniref:Peptidase A1 domain-containing protein n=1 Tax=Dendrobium nobile TaxID=94219 RepID=A0A8T3AIK5_DENNO|nr:hypothetical protein KFK09_022416 [Dendrobium nobile]